MIFLGKNRDRISIITAILEAAKFGARKTRILFGAHLNFWLLKKYLNTVVNAVFFALREPGMS